MNREDLIGLRWAEDVVSGKFIANKYVKLECKRYIDRINEYPKGYFFNYKEVKFVYDLLSMINYATGFYANEPIIKHIAGFQAMIIENIFGWQNIETKQRMITDVTLLVGRKSGKSVLCALLEILLMLTGERFEQHAIAGSIRDISKIVKRETEQLIKSSPIIKKYFKIQRDKLEYTLNESYMRALSGDANMNNGLLLSTYICDEVGNMKTQDIIGALRLSQFMTKQRLGIHISTAYNLPKNAMRDLCDLHKKVLDGSIDDIHSFGLLFELDENDDYKDMNNWIKASPLQMTLKNGIEFMKSEFNKGLEIPEKMAEFRIKMLNQWINDANVENYIELDDFRKCSVKEIEFAGKEVVIGLDLSASQDLTGITMVFKENEKYYCKGWAFAPRKSLIERQAREKIPYDFYVEKGLVIASGERVIDYNEIEEFICTLEEKYDVKIKSIAYDRQFSAQLIQRLQNKSFECVEVAQSFTGLTNATRILSEKVLLNDFYYLENPLMEVQITNCRIVRNMSNQIIINKKQSNGKIDIIASLINTFVVLEEPEPEFFIV